MPGHESVARARKRDGHVPERHSDSRTLSCSECRRLKLRCDRQWPCQSCVKRGCASICPNGSLTPGGGGNRFILHGSEQLHKKIRDMSERIGQLEDSVACMWAAKTGNNGVEHPLLRKELLKIKLPPDTQNAEPISASATSKDPTASANTDKDPPNVDDSNDCQEEDADCVTAELGTLTLGSHGKMNYMGRSAKIEYILKAENAPDSTYSPESTSSDAFTPNAATPPASNPSTANTSAASNSSSGDMPALPQEITNISHSFLFSVPPDCSVTISTLRSYLPPLTRGWALCEAYFEHAGWFYSPINRDDFINNIFTVFYSGGSGANLASPPSSHSSPSSEPSPTSDDDDSSPTSHDLAVLFMVFAVGALVDLTSPPFNAESSLYHTLARAAICLEPLSSGEGSTISLVQALNLMIYYSVQWDQNSVDVEGTWLMMGLASKLAISLGLHRDSARWGLEAADVQKRRWVFWELFTMDSWQSLGYGRPPSMNLENIDCKLPDDPEEKKNEEGRVIQRSFTNYKYDFVRHCVQPVSQHIFSTKPFTYAAVHNLDRKVRAFDFGDLASELGPNPTVASLMQRHILLCTREFTLLYIHRSFFTRVMVSNPNSPLDSPYSSSVLATFRCAVTLLQIVKTCYQKHPALISRFWLAWTYLLTSAVVTGSICSRGPRSSLAPAAYNQLRIAVEMFESSQAHSPRTARAMPVLYRLQHKAHQALIAVGPGPSSSLPPAGVNTDKGTQSVNGNGSHNPGLPTANGSSSENVIVPPEDVCDELIAYGGKARVIRTDAHHNHGAHSHANSPGATASPPVVGGSQISPAPLKGALQSPPTQSQSQSSFGSPLTILSAQTTPNTPSGLLANSPWMPSGPNALSSNQSPQVNLNSFLTTNSVQAHTTPSSQYALPLPPTFDSSPYVHFTQEPVNPSSIPIASAPLERNRGLSNMTGTGRTLSGTGTPTQGHDAHLDLSWLDGFGMGTPMDQFPVVGHQTAPMIFNSAPASESTNSLNLMGTGMPAANSWNAGSIGSSVAQPYSHFSWYGDLGNSDTRNGLGNGVGGTQNTWDFGFGASDNAAIMDMSVDSGLGTNSGGAEPALNDANWQQFMQKLFTTGVQNQDSQMNGSQV